MSLTPPDVGQHQMSPSKLNFLVLKLPKRML